MHIPTLTVKRTDGHTAIINADDFDPALHTVTGGKDNPEPEDVDRAYAGTTLDDLSDDKLLALAKGAGIPRAGRMKRATLIDRLKDHSLTL